MDPTSGPSSVPAQAPLRNPKYRHISRSAAKRESVQLLGSIKDLQLHFSRVGVEHKPGAGAGVKGASLDQGLGQGLGTVGEDDDDGNVPSLRNGERRQRREREGRQRRPWKEVELARVDVGAAREEARGIIASIKDLWGLGYASVSPVSPVSPDPPVASTSNTGTTRSITITNVASATQDSKALLIATARSIRRVRTLALFTAHAQGSRRPSGSTLPRVPKGRQSISTPSRPGGMPRAVSHGEAERKSSLGPTSDLAEVAHDDALADLRNAALEVLAGLRALEENLRVQPPSPTILFPARALSPMDCSSGSSVISTDPGTSVRPESSLSNGIYEEPEGLNDGEEYNLNALAAAEGEMQKHLGTWEERIVSERRDYRGLEAREGVKEREAVRRWVGVVERVFEVVVGKEEVPKWAREWGGTGMERVHEFLLAHLPFNLQCLLPPTTAEGFPYSLLSRLSDGLLLIHAFNLVVLSSPKPWGFVPEEDIHDTLSATHGESATPASQAEERVSKKWTFRRVGNLICWAAALRIRYNLPIHIVSAASKRKDGDSQAQMIQFDPLIVAKRLAAWEEMLSGLLTRWVEEAAKETREARGTGQTGRTGLGEGREAVGVDEDVAKREDGRE